jgi:hypothetical protein
MLGLLQYSYDFTWYTWQIIDSNNASAITYKQKAPHNVVYVPAILWLAT